MYILILTGLWDLVLVGDIHIMVMDGATHITDGDIRDGVITLDGAIRDGAILVITQFTMDTTLTAMEEEVQPLTTAAETIPLTEATLQTETTLLAGITARLTETTHPLTEAIPLTDLIIFQITEEVLPQTEHQVQLLQTEAVLLKTIVTIIQAEDRTVHLTLTEVITTIITTATHQEAIQHQVLHLPVLTTVEAVAEV